METMPSALVKDLLSTGYFYKELRSYGESKEIDLAIYIRNYTIPYLFKLSDAHIDSGQAYRYEIFNLVVKCLTEANDDALVESILDLKKMTAEEIDSNERVLHQLNRDDISHRVCHRKSQAAQTLSKLLVSIIKMFKLVERGTKKKTQQAVEDTVISSDAVKDLQELTISAK